MTEINRTPKHSHIIIIAPSLNRKTDRLLLVNRLMMPTSPPIAPAHIKVSKTPHFAHQIFTRINKMPCNVLNFHQHRAATLENARA